ncbi:transmembrane protein 74B [Cyclopterus lumpus]|uniref:transmembrane protein 74B n=1 Tax=Cyclopterus lumpus TaxID=8103 RepID=UPI001486C570|nr:transmembrane protein 74B [Cyclopterus lumpus]
MESSFKGVELRELRGGGARRGEAPVGCAARGFENASYQQDEEHDLRQQGATEPAGAPPSTSGTSKGEQQHQERSPRSYDEEEGGGGGWQEDGQDFPEFHPSDDRSADYGFIFALVFLVSGIVLVVIAYTIPREAKVDPDSVSARQMEKLELHYARLGSHLDKCIIAGLGLLTLGGMFLSVLLMVSICRGEMHRSRAAFVRPKRTYGSINLRMKQLATGESGGGDDRDRGEEFLVERVEMLDPKWDSKSEPGPSRTPPPPALLAPLPPASSSPSSSAAPRGVN